MLFRPAHPGDVAEARSWDEDPDTVAQLGERASDLLYDTSILTVVCVHHGRVVGWAAARPHPDRSARLEAWVSVAPNARGRHLASSMLEHLERSCDERGFELVAEFRVENVAVAYLTAVWPVHIQRGPVRIACRPPRTNVSSR